jgi:amidophosphoribosyltransferase
LIASSHSIEEIRAFIGADSLGYLDETDLYSFLRDGQPRTFCDACFTGRYPVLVSPDDEQPIQLHLFEAKERNIH